MVEIIFIICMCLIALRILSSMDKEKDLEILRLKKELKNLGGNRYEPRNSENQQRGIYNSNRK